MNKIINLKTIKTLFIFTKYIIDNLCYRNDVKDITLCSGSSVLYGNCTVHNVTKAFIHESYNPIVTDYDIGLIKVIPPFTYNNNTKAVDLPNGCTSKETSGLVCGWGYNSVMMKYSDIK